MFMALRTLLITNNTLAKKIILSLSKILNTAPDQAISLRELARLAFVFFRNLR